MDSSMSTSLRMAEDPRLQETPLQVVKRLFFVSFLMFTMPFVAYFTSKKYLFEDLLQYSSNTSNLLAVIPAVVAVNTVIGIYIYLAWNSEPWKEKFQERTKDE